MKVSLRSSISRGFFTAFINATGDCPQTNLTLPGPVHPHDSPYLQQQKDTGLPVMKKRLALSEKNYSSRSGSLNGWRKGFFIPSSAIVLGLPWPGSTSVRPSRLISRVIMLCIRRS